MGHTVRKRGRQRRGKERIWLIVKITEYHGFGCFFKLFYYLPLASQIFRAQRAVPTFWVLFITFILQKSSFVRLGGDHGYVETDPLLSRCCSHLNDRYYLILKSIFAGDTTYCSPHGLYPVVLLFSLFYEKGFTTIINKKVGCLSSCHLHVIAKQ